HSEHLADMTDRGLRQPAAVLLLGAPQQRNDRRLLAAGRVFLDLLLRPGRILSREGKFLRLKMRVGQTTDGHNSSSVIPERGRQSGVHRSTSPNTISSEPSTADTSASMWPRQRKSIAWRWAKPGARILHLYGLLVPSDTR